MKRLISSGSTRGRSSSIDSVDATEQQDNDSHASGDEENKQKNSGPPAKNFEHLNDQRWRDFCEKKLKKFETKWSKRLETYTDEDHERMRQEEEEADVNDVLVVIDTAADESAFSDTVEDPANKEFLASNFWKVEDQYNIDDLLADFEE